MGLGKVCTPNCKCDVIFEFIFLRFSLKGQFKPIAEEEVTRLQEFARSEGFTDKLQMWDVPYWRRRQKQHLFKYFILIFSFDVHLKVLQYSVVLPIAD